MFLPPGNLTSHTDAAYSLMMVIGSTLRSSSSDACSASSVRVYAGAASSYVAVLPACTAGKLKNPCYHRDPATLVLTMSPARTSSHLDEQLIQDSFHSYLRSSLAQAKAERLLDEDVLSSAQGDLMITGTYASRLSSDNLVNFNL